MKKMKNIMIVVIALFAITGCGKREYTEVSYDQLKQKLENKDSFVLVMGSATCSACAKYKTTMEKVMTDKKVEIFYIDLNAVSEEEYAKIYSEYVIVSTPTTVFFVDGKEKTTYDRIIGAASYNDIIKSLKKYEFVEE